VLSGEHATDSTNARLDLVKDQRYASLVTKLTQRQKVTIRWDDIASTSGDRLNYYACDTARTGVFYKVIDPFYTQ
jgi:hypothetical protein